MENRNGIAVNGCVNLAQGRAEPEAALAMVEEIPGQQRAGLCHLLAPWAELADSVCE